MKDGKLKIIVRGCHNLTVFRDLVDKNPGELPEEAKVSLLPCSSKIEAHLLLKFFEQGADGVLILACPLGGCRLVEGNRRAAKRAAYAGGWLEELGIDPARIVFIPVDAEQGRDLLGLINNFCSSVAQMGPTGIADN